MSGELNVRTVSKDTEISKGRFAGQGKEIKDLSFNPAAVAGVT